MNEFSDEQLLREFARLRSEGCFAELVRRYVDLVYSVALRLTRNPITAEDVSQAVFIALAQRAATLAQRRAGVAPLSAWLHLTTRNLATKHIRGEARRRNREREAMIMCEHSSDEREEVWDLIAPHLDHAMEELPTEDRHALLLRFFERQSARQIGLRLGVSEEAAQKRVARALARLRERFFARGLSSAGLPSASALALALENKAIQAAPSTLVTCLTKAGMLAVATTTPPATALLTKLFTSIAMTKTQSSILTILTAALLVPLGIQRAEVNRLKQEVASVSQLPPQQLRTPTQPSPQAEINSTEAEIARLARLRDELRARIQKPANRSTPSASLLSPGPTLLQRGRSVSLTELGFAGNATPEAALQSSLVFARDGNLPGFLQLALVPPSQVNKLKEILESPEQTQSLQQELADMLRGAVAESSVELGPDQKTVADHHYQMKLPDNPSGAVNLELIETHKIDDRNVELVLKIERGEQTTTETLSLGLTQGGWKTLSPL